MSTATLTLVDRAVNTMRGLAIDAVQKANSGHPGLPLGASPMAYALWMRHLRFNPRNPHWFNRDRFILSAGHGSALLYTLLHLTGYDLSLDDLKQFRQLHSRTPGHPENHMTPGVEMATGPLGQGCATAVGYAIAEKFLGATFNKPGHDVIDHFTYVICGDGDLMEGISSEAASLAGHLKLGKLIFLYDDNLVSLDGPTNMAFTENVRARFEAYDWHTIWVEDGMDVDAVDKAIEKAKAVTDKPSLILCRTIIGFGSPNKAGTSKAHGSPLGPDEMVLTKKALGIPLEPNFDEPADVLLHFHSCVDRGAKQEKSWNDAFSDYQSAFPAEAQELKDAIARNLGTKWLDALPTFKAGDKIATRMASGQTINAIAPQLPLLLAGSADLGGSNETEIKGLPPFQPETPTGRTMWYGVREHAMAAALNGLNLHGATRAFGGTFLIFSDYCRPSIRLAALMNAPTIFVFTHDSVGVGEDGPTHEPIEQASSLRLIPNVNFIRPADANETAAAWKVAMQTKETPVVLALSRQALPVVTPADVKNHPLEKGAYVLEDADGKADVIIIATGSEIQHAVAARTALASEGVKARVVSMPSWFLFERQDASYRESVLPHGIPKIAMEAGTTAIWYKYADAVLGIDRFGLSAPGDIVMKELGMTPENLVIQVRALLARKG